jgi:NitT/TauT family transport system ATP-binding protein
VGTIDLRNVSVTFVGRTGQPYRAVEDVNLKIDDSRFLCLLGPSGCGKSTLLNIIAGFERPSSGEALMDGAPINGPSTRRAMIFQNVQGALLPWLSASENVAFGLRMRGVPKHERASKALRYLRLVGLEGHEAKFPFELSGGMKQRVQIARALANDPEVLLMDEPFGSLDAYTRGVLQRELLGIWAEMRKTIIFVTHDVIESVILADRVAVMGPGPGSRIISLVDIDCPRPRRISDPAIGGLARQIEDLIQPTVKSGGEVVP